MGSLEHINDFRVPRKVWNFMTELVRYTFVHLKGTEQCNCLELLFPVYETHCPSSCLAGYSGLWWFFVQEVLHWSGNAGWKGSGGKSRRNKSSGKFELNSNSNSLLVCLVIL